MAKKKIKKSKIVEDFKSVTDKISKGVADSAGVDIENETITINEVSETGLGTLRGTICINIELCGGRVFDGMIDFEIDEEIIEQEVDEENDNDDEDDEEEYDEDDEKEEEE